jgi:SAM-dependent methyltransferase
MAEDLLFDLRLGVDTRRFVALDRSSPVLGENAAHGRDYHPTRVRHLRALLRALALPPGLGFLDLGSGKGRVLILAAGQPFSRVVGVEYAPELCTIARQNLERARAGRVELLQADAAALEIADDLHVFYAFNPFDEVVLAAVLTNIGASLRRAPRPAWIILNKARHDPLIPLAGAFAPILDLRYGNAEFRVFTSRLSRSG